MILLPDFRIYSTYSALGINIMYGLSSDISLK